MLRQDHDFSPHKYPTHSSFACRPIGKADAIGVAAAQWNRRSTVIRLSVGEIGLQNRISRDAKIGEPAPARGPTGTQLALANLLAIVP
jgi:hypothetical protein